ncbi:MAG: hypothetical protein P4M07_12940 [Xanthobacteraceae bacterium]|nr:hypothetical protein [Xanthobacteraceae bacterium]
MSRKTAFSVIAGFVGVAIACSATASEATVRSHKPYALARRSSAAFESNDKAVVPAPAPVDTQTRGIFPGSMPDRMNVNGG